MISEFEAVPNLDSLGYSATSSFRYHYHYNYQSVLGTVANLIKALQS